MTRVLVVERCDEHRASALLSEEAFVVVTAVDTGEVIDVLDTLMPEIVVVEVSTLSMHVLQLCASIRTATSIPLVVLTGSGSERDAIAAFTAGADSVVREPVGSHELVARVRALLRRIPAPSEPNDDLITLGPIVLDRARREVTVLGQSIAVPRREFEIAELLMQQAGRVVARATLVRELWGSMRDTKSLDVQVGRLRARLLAASGHQCIVTVRGVGFRFATASELDQRGDVHEIDLVALEGDDVGLNAVT
jgi:two-component system response regulator RegX3